MNSIEEEFQNLMKGVLDTIQTKKDNGEYDEWDAAALTAMVQNVMDHGDDSRHGYQCPEGHTDPNCGWSPSMGYHCW